MKNIEERLKSIEAKLNMIKQGTKDVLTVNELTEYTGLSKSYLYKLTMRQEIPHYKPSGKQIYFNRDEINKWLQQNRVSTHQELNQQAQTFCIKGTY